MSIRLSFIRTEYHLSCESLSNQGATFEMFKNAIESIEDPGLQGRKLSCVRSGLNGNVGFMTYLANMDELIFYDIVDRFEVHVLDALKRGSSEKNV